MKEVTAALLVDQGKLLIAQRGWGDALEGKWEFPGGKIEPGETPENCLAREMLEEFNLQIIVGDFYAKSIYTYPKGQIALLAYWAYLPEGQLDQLKLAVHSDYRWVSTGQLKDFDFAPADIPIVEKLCQGQEI